MRILVGFVATLQKSHNLDLSRNLEIVLQDVEGYVTLWFVRYWVLTNNPQSPQHCKTLVLLFSKTYF